VTREQYTALLAYAVRVDDIALIFGARHALMDDPQAIAWCETQVEMMQLSGEEWK
jgi:hypothetical protein